MAVDKTWESVKEYCRKELNQQETKHEKYFFDSYNPDDMQKVIDTQFKVIEYVKNKGYNKLYSICIVVDDFVDMPKFCHSNNSLLNTLFIKGRHMSISTLSMTQ